MIFSVNSVEQTTQIGIAIGKLLNPGDIICLTGDLGTGKTHITKGIAQGLEIEDYITKPAKVKILKTDTEKNISRLEITIHEGKNRQVRKMCEAVGRKVIALHRSKIGNIVVKDIELGKWRYLDTKEVEQLIKVTR